MELAHQGLLQVFATVELVGSKQLNRFPLPIGYVNLSGLNNSYLTEIIHKHSDFVGHKVQDFV